MSIVIAGCWLKLGLKDDVVDGDVLILTEPIVLSAVSRGWLVSSCRTSVLSVMLCSVGVLAVLLHFAELLFCPP